MQDTCAASTPQDYSQNDLAVQSHKCSRSKSPNTQCARAWRHADGGAPCATALLIVLVVLAILGLFVAAVIGTVIIQKVVCA